MANLSADFISNLEQYAKFTKPHYEPSPPPIVAIQQLIFTKNVPGYPQGHYKAIIRDATNVIGIIALFI